MYDAFWLCGISAVAEDGSVFHPVILYNIAGKNIGIVHQVGNKRKVFGEKLYSSAHIASAKAKEFAEAYNQKDEEWKNNYLSSDGWLTSVPV